MSLTFPYPEAPPPGVSVEIVPGIRWLRMPLPLALNHINLYLLEDDDGWYVVDTGISDPDTKRYWQQIIANDLGGLPIKGVIVTHMHPDHSGLSGWLCEQHGVPLYMTHGEFFVARVFADMPGGISWTTEQYMRRHGASDERIEAMRKRDGNMGLLMDPMPLAYRRLEDGLILHIGGRDWEIMIGEGHSPEHACLYCSELGVLLSGDQVIAGISSNVSVGPTEPEGNPLADWLRTLKVFGQLPDDTLVLPAHKLPFRGVVQRVDELIQHHEDHMLALEKACTEPKILPQLLPVMFKRELDANHMMMAEGECIAHLHLLMQRGLMKRELTADGLYYFTTIDPAVEQRQLPADYEGDEPPELV